MRYLIFFAVVMFGLAIGAIVSAYPGEFGSPATPQPIVQNPALAHYDIQSHSRDSNTWGDNATESMAAQHGANCSAPPATHENHSYSGTVFVCNDHLMTAINAQGYGMVAVTPSQLLNCSTSCVVQWDMSTERLSTRDWPDVWLTPWNDNLTLPFDNGSVDLQGMPRQGIHINGAANENGWHCTTIANYVETELGCPYYLAMDWGVTAGTNTAAVRQTFKLTITTGHMKFERLASATVPQYTFIDTACACLMAPDYVVQFAQHSYNPTKDGAGVPATWHWSNFTLTPSTPFTLIHTTPRAVMTNNSLVTFDSPAPANAYLRFSGVGQITITPNGSAGFVAPKQTFTGYYEHASNYFVPIPQGTQSVSVNFAPDGWYTGPYIAQDFHVWSKGGTPPSTPTPNPASPTPSATATNIPTSTPLPTATSTSVPVPTSTPTVIPPTATSTVTAVPPTPTSTSVPPTATSTAVPPTSTAVPPTPTPNTTLCYRSTDGGNTIVKVAC